MKPKRRRKKQDTCIQVSVSASIFGNLTIIVPFPNAVSLRITKGLIMKRKEYSWLFSKKESTTYFLQNILRKAAIHYPSGPPDPTNLSNSFCWTTTHFNYLPVPLYTWLTGLPPSSWIKISSSTPNQIVFLYNVVGRRKVTKKSTTKAVIKTFAPNS